MAKGANFHFSEKKSKLFFLTCFQKSTTRAFVRSSLLFSRLFSFLSLGVFGTPATFFPWTFRCSFCHSIWMRYNVIWKCQSELHKLYPLKFLFRPQSHNKQNSMSLHCNLDEACTGLHQNSFLSLHLSLNLLSTKTQKNRCVTF